MRDCWYGQENGEHAAVVTVLVSAIIPTYNRANFLLEAINSALDQSLPGGDVEVIVVDDGSTDNTPELVGSFGPLLHYLRRPNGREGAARNTGAQVATGKYLAFLDSDDYWLPGKLAGDVARMQRSDEPVFVYSRAINVTAANEPLPSRLHAAPEGDIFWQLARKAYVPMSSVTVRADAFRLCTGFQEDPALSGTCDWELWMRMAARWPVGFVDQLLTCIRVHKRNMLSDPALMERSMLTGLKYALADPVVAERARGRAQVVRSWVYIAIALNAYANGRRVRSWRWLANSLLVWPPQALDPHFWGALARTLLGPNGVHRVRPLLFALGAMRPLPVHGPPHSVLVRSHPVSEPGDRTVVEPDRAELRPR